MLSEIRASGRFVPDLSLVAGKERRIAEHDSVISADPRDDEQKAAYLQRTLFLGAISVSPAFQCQGSRPPPGPGRIPAKQSGSDGLSACEWPRRTRVVWCLLISGGRHQLHLICDSLRS